MNSSDKPIVFFDGKCNLCNSAVDQMIKWDKHKRFYISSLQGETAQKLLHSLEYNGSMDSVVLLTKKKVYFRSTAAILIASNLRWFLKPFYVMLIIPKFIRDGLYRYIAKNRYRWFGKKETCRLPSKDEESYFLP